MNEYVQAFITVITLSVAHVTHGLPVTALIAVALA